VITFTVLENSNGSLTKRFHLDESDTLAKRTAGKLYTGKATRRSVSSPAEFASFLSTLQPNQALAFGVTERAEAPIVTQAEVSKTPGAIARDRQHFRYTQGASVWFLDYDYDRSTATEAPLTPSEVRAKLIEACPALESAPMVAVPSASSYLYDGEKQLLGPGGVHLYVFVQNGAGIPRAGKALYEHTWRTGCGRFVVGKAGQLLDRSLLDGSVWQPEREDFAAGAVCVPPLEQRRPAPQLWNADAALFDSRLIADPTAEEQEAIRQKRAEARETVEPSRKQARDAYVVERVKELTEHGIDANTAQRTAEAAADSRMLLADFRLQHPDGKEVTVGEVLANPSKYHAARFRDPLEPDYRGDTRIAHANLFSGGRPYVYSHAHGGRRFELYPQTRTLQIQPGELPRRQDDVLEVLRLNGNVFDQPIGSAEFRMVYVANGCIVPFGEVSLQTHLGRFFRFEKYDGRAKACVPVDTPLALVRGIIAETTSRKLPVLEGVVSDPVMRTDGTILATAGYSERDRLFSEYSDILQAPIPEHPTDEQLRGAFATLWRPFEGFPFTDGDTRGAMLAALLTAVVRSTIPTAPAFMFEAPAAGSGKSLLAKCVSALATGRRAVPESPPAGDEEQKKTLFAALRGGARIIFWDNVVAPVYGTSSLCAFVTSPRFGGRVLGVSQTEELPNKALLLLTGNNPRIEGDACRRVIRVRIDAQVEHPSLRAFDLEPESFVLDHRSELWTAALTILRGFHSRGAPKQTPDRAGSFEDWDRMVRQCVLWLNREGLATGELGDPYATAIANIQEDPVKDVVSTVLQAWHALFSSEWKKPGEALAALGFDEAGRTALEAIDAKGLSTVRFGYWLRQHVDERVGDLRLQRLHNSVTKRWEFRVTESQPPSASAPGRNISPAIAALL
jgi:hypothetical protein